MTLEDFDNELVQQIESIAELPLDQRVEALAAAEKALRAMLDSPDPDPGDDPDPAQ